MNCPYCNTPNEPNNQFCVSCGRELAAAGMPGGPASLTARETLGMVTMRILLALLGLWIIRAVVMGLSFVRQMRIPDFDIAPVTIIGLLFGLVAIYLLVVYARDLGHLWRAAFPGCAEIGGLLVALIYVLILGALYSGLAPLIASFGPQPEVMLLVQLVLFVFALVLVGRAALVAYQSLAPWLTRFIANLRQH